MKLFLKVLLIGAMTFGLLFALLLVFGLISERKSYRDEAVANVAAAVGQAQKLAGPVLIVPYTDISQRLENGRLLTEEKEGEWLFFPENLVIDGELRPAIRKRGLHQVRIYEWQGRITAKFDVRMPEAQTLGDIRRIPGAPFVSWGVSDVRGLRGSPVIRINKQPRVAEQGSGLSAISGLRTGLDESLVQNGKLAFDSELVMTLAGTERIAFLPLGRNNDIRLKSSWPHPSFSGILPTHEISPQGFTAHWQVSALATDARKSLSSGNLSDDDNNLTQVSLLDPVNPYLKAERATKYGVLFIVLTFAAFLLFELVKRVSVHPVQYGLVGLALAIFFLLLTSLSEYLAFGWAYLAAATACLGLIAVYLAAVLGGVRRALGFVAMLCTLYGALYGLLIMEDNALLVGSGLLFVILAAIMLGTRKLDWYALTRELSRNESKTP